MSASDPTVDPGEQLITIWLDVADRVGPADYHSVDDLAAVSGQARADSRHWAHSFFSPAASPHQAAKVRHSVHLARADTPDLLRHEYAFGGLDLEVIESRSFTLIRIAPAALDVLALPEAERPRAVKRAAESLLHLEGAHHKWDFQLPALLAEGVRFSTNPAADPLGMRHWHERADGGIRRRALYFLCFKKIGQILGYHDVQRWFDDDFRARTGPHPG